MQATSFKKLHVLIGDAQPQSTRFVVELCRALGIVELRTAATADEVIAALGKARADVLLCVWTRALDAPALTRIIRQDAAKPYQRVRIIVARGEATAADVSATRDSGADQFLSLPVSQGALLAVLQRATTLPQHFVDCEVYKGPDRRRRQLEWENERRRVEGERQGDG